MLRFQSPNCILKPPDKDARRSRKTSRDPFCRTHEKFRVAAFNLRVENLRALFVDEVEMSAVCEPVLQQTIPACDCITFDLLVSARCNRNASPGNDHDPALGDVFLELLDKCLSIHPELLTMPDCLAAIHHS